MLLMPPVIVYLTLLDSAYTINWWMIPFLRLGC